MAPPPVTTKPLPPSNLAKLLAQQDPVGDILRRSPFCEITEALERQDNLLRDLRQPAFHALTKSQQWPDLSATLHAARRANQRTLANATRVNDSVLRAARDALATTDAFARYRELDGELNRAILSASRATLPVPDLRSVVERTLAALQPTKAFADAIKGYETALARFTKLTIPWALDEYPELSAAGFARILRLRNSAALHAPYGPATSEIYDEELGEPVPFDPDATTDDREAAAIEAGTNPEVIAFPAPAFPGVLIVAGFEFELSPLDPPASNAGDRSGGFDPRHHYLLHQVEHRLRVFIEAELSQIAGEAWIRKRVPEPMRKKWRDRQQEDHDDRGDSYSPIFYADLTDLSDLICKNDNWEDAFRSVFKHKDELQLGIRRLTPIRRALAHARPLPRTDQLFLASEALRILLALKAVI